MSAPDPHTPVTRLDWPAVVRYFTEIQVFLVSRSIDTRLTINCVSDHEDSAAICLRIKDGLLLQALVSRDTGAVRMTLDKTIRLSTLPLLVPIWDNSYVAFVCKDESLNTFTVYVANGGDTRTIDTTCDEWLDFVDQLRCTYNENIGTRLSDAVYPTFWFNNAYPPAALLCTTDSVIKDAVVFTIHKIESAPFQMTYYRGPVSSLTDLSEPTNQFVVPSPPPTALFYYKQLEANLRQWVQHVPLMFEACYARDRVLDSSERAVGRRLIRSAIDKGDVWELMLFFTGDALTHIGYGSNHRQSVCSDTPGGRVYAWKREVDPSAFYMRASVAHVNPLLAELIRSSLPLWRATRPVYDPPTQDPPEKSIAIKDDAVVLSGKKLTTAWSALRTMNTAEAISSKPPFGDGGEEGDLV